MQANAISLSITRILLACWILMKLVSAALWNSSRPFPLSPIAEIFNQLPNWFHLLLYWTSLFCMMIFVFFKTKKILWIVLIAEIISCLLDQSRWQPWEYQNILMLGCYMFFTQEKQVLTSWQTGMIGIYFFSGFSKLQPAFIHDIWMKIVMHQWLHVHPTNIIIIRAGYMLALLELSAAIALCFNRWRKTGMVVLIIMHCTILLVLGPWGINFNKIVWPWNAMMICLLILLFLKEQFVLQRTFFKQAFAWVVIACFCILPFFGLINKWDHYLSFNLYSGGIKQLYICTDDKDVKQKLGRYFVNTSSSVIPCSQSISSFAWAMKVTNTPGYPEQRIFISIAKYCKKEFPQAAVKFYVYTPGFGAHVDELNLNR